MQTQRQDKSSLNVLDVEVYVADLKSKKWLTYHTTEASPFTYCGVDMFGLFCIKEKRSELKRYEAMFVCLASRAVHIEVTRQIDTDSFVQTLWRMIARRGNVRLIQSDNGSNFSAAESELKKAFLEMYNAKISRFLQDRDADWIIWQRNTLQPVTWLVSENDKIDL